MIGIITKAGLAALIALGGVAASVSAASAGSDVGFGMYVAGGDRDRDRDRGWHGGRPDRPSRDRCAPWMAEEKADRMGLRRARVVDVSPRRVVVGGFSRNGRDRIVFANERGCPVIRR